MKEDDEIQQSDLDGTPSTDDFFGINQHLLTQEEVVKYITPLYNDFINLLGTNLVEQFKVFFTLDVEAQQRLLDSIRSKFSNKEHLVRCLYYLRLANSLSDRSTRESPMDTDVYNLQMGHEVVLVTLVTDTGYTVSMSRLLNVIIRTADVLSVDGEFLDKDEHEVIVNHGRFTMPDSVGYTLLRGTVVEIPVNDVVDYFQLRLDTGEIIQVGIDEVKLAAVIGYDRDLITIRAKGQVKIHDEAQIFIHGTWVSCIVRNFFKENSIEVICSQVITPDLDYPRSHIASVSINSDSFSHPQIPQSIEKINYPGLCADSAVMFEIGKEVIYGVIYDYSLTESKIYVRDANSRYEFSIKDLKNASLKVIGTIKDKFNPKSLIGSNYRVYDQKGNPQIYEILGFDSEHDIVIGRRVSIGQADYITAFSRDGVEIVGDPSGFFIKYPKLKAVNGITIRFTHQGYILEGDMINSKTLPAHIEASVISYFGLKERFLVKPEHVNAIVFMGDTDLLPEGLVLD